MKLRTYEMHGAVMLRYQAICWRGVMVMLVKRIDIARWRFGSQNGNGGSLCCHAQTVEMRV